MKKQLILLPFLAVCAALAQPPQEVKRIDEPFKVGIAGYTFHKFKLPEALAMMKRTDVHYLCIKDFHLPFKSTDEEIAAFKKTCADSGVTGYALGPIYSTTREEIDRDFAFAKRVGVNLIVGVPVTVDANKKRHPSPELLKYVETKVKETDIRYAVHNHGPDGIPYATADETMGYIKDLDSRIGLCLDIGHNARANEDPFEALEKYKDRVYDIHWKNITEFSKKGRGIEVSRGKLDYPQFVKTLRKINYTGVCSLEYEKDMDDPLPGIAESVGYFRGVMDTLR